MTDLTSCYFCGTAEAAEAGPAVPPSLDPPPAAQQSVVLCPSCREKLTAVLDPLFEGDRTTGGSEAPDSGWSFQGGEASGADRRSATDHPGDGEEPASRTDRSADPGSPDDSPGDGDAPAPRADRPDDGEDETGDDLPDQYHTVLRFLKNREFPVAREEILSVVAGAYDLSEREVGAVIDTAVERGVLVEADGRLARSRDRL